MNGSQRRKGRNNKQQTTNKQHSCFQIFLENCIVTHAVIKLLYLHGNLRFIVLSTTAYQIYINTELSISSVLKL
jgi:hypothetical protein